MKEKTHGNYCPFADLRDKYSPSGVKSGQDYFCNRRDTTNFSTGKLINLLCDSKDHRTCKTYLEATIPTSIDF